MPIMPARNHVELLLELLELTSLGPTSTEQAARQLRRERRFGGGGSARRAADRLAILTAEGLAEAISGERETLYRITPSGLATLEEHGRFPGGAAVMFTDIVGSTELILCFGEAGAHERRQRHFNLLRQAIHSNDGREVKNLGDGLMVIFASPAAAAECSMAMQRAVAGDRDQLGLRVGLHVGELLREGNDFFGTTVIVARRLCEVAAGGQTLASAVLVALAGDGAAASAQPLGAIELKGIGLPVEGCELAWGGSGTGGTRTAGAARTDRPALLPRRRFSRQAPAALEIDG